jgi:hypothetical protein
LPEGFCFVVPGKRKITFVPDSVSRLFSLMVLPEMTLPEVSLKWFCPELRLKWCSPAML